ncbi:MAG: methionyl-tRNA formyltransferase [Magnetovibrionaceae bacterium]
MRIAFMGSPDFSVGILDALGRAGHEIACVYAQPPRPAGRGQKDRPCPVHAFAEQQGWPVRTPRRLKSREDQEAFAALDLDVAVVAAYGLILPKAILEAPKFGCLNVHASLLPRWRGAAPIQRAILAGDEKTGVTIMQMDEGLDTGDMLLVGETEIGPETTGGSLHDDLAAMGAALMVEALGKLESLTPQSQPEEGVTYAEKLSKDEGRIDWSRPAAELDRRIRGLTPWPGCWFERGGKRIKLLSAKVTSGSGQPGQPLSGGAIACGQAALLPVTVQPQGKKAMDWDAYLRGKSLEPGEMFG